MSDQSPYDELTSGVIEGLRAKLGVRARTLEAALAKARYRLPRRVHAQAMTLVAAGSMAQHPRLRQMLDMDALAAAAAVVNAHLETIDPSDRRKGFWLGALGGLVFNLILMAVALGGFLVWYGNL
ncbi:MAG: hypothetical protein L3J36_03065 [Rhodobacteraceae bacterium]|nr:hypothetical protein [Paracoccaceae bacterium]